MLRPSEDRPDHSATRGGRGWSKAKPRLSVCRTGEVERRSPGLPFGPAPATRLLACSILLAASALLLAQDAEPKAAPARGSVVEDRAARKLLEAGDSRLEADEPTKAVEVWQSVIERYPRSRVRFEAHMRLGKQLLDKDRAYDRARVHFEAAAAEENSDEEVRAEATLQMGVCFYEARNFGKCFTVMRDVIEHFPVSPQVNSAYYYIGLGHFQLGHYSRAIAALERVGTSLASEEGKTEKIEAGKRFYVKIEDADLAVLEPGRAVKLDVESGLGDTETISAFAVGRNVRLVLGSILTSLGKPKPGNGILEVRGNDTVKVTYTDSHTADKTFDRPVLKEVTVVGAGLVEITDGAFAESLRGVILGRPMNLQITDPDLDLTDGADTLKAVVEVFREKSQEELDAEAAKAAAQASEARTPPAEEEVAKKTAEEEEAARLKVIDRLEVTLTEAKITRPTLADDDPPEAKPAPKAEKPAESKPTTKAGVTGGSNPVADAASVGKKATAENPTQAASATEPDDGSMHTGVFRTAVMLAKVEQPIAGDEILQALPGDTIRVTYIDERNITDDARTLVLNVKCIEGNIGEVRVTRSVISDQELRIQTQLKTASALTNIASRYKEFGLKKNADAKYQQALDVCDGISDDAQKLGGKLLEELYVQLWQIYFEMDKLELAATMCQRLQREFPQSGFVDDALLQLADVVRKQGDLQRAIGMYVRLVEMKTSQLRGEAQFGIAECYSEMAKAQMGPAADQLRDRAFQEYKKVFDNFPDSGRVGEAVAQMANYYFQQKDYARAVDVFESVLNEHPDAKFLDVILFNYGRCLYRMEKRTEARRQFDQLIGDFPESPLAEDAKKISEELAKRGF